MKIRTLLSSLLLAASIGGPAVSPTQAALTNNSEAEQKRAEIRAMRDDVLKELYREEPRLKKRVENAVGYAVFSNVGVSVVIASFAGGRGMVVEPGMFGDKETFMKMGSAGIGLGLGIKDFRAVFIFTDKQTLKDFVKKGWDFSGQADVVAKSDKKGGSLEVAGTIVPGMEIYQLTKNGLALQATVQGTKYWQDKDLN